MITRKLILASTAMLLFLVGVSLWAQQRDPRPPQPAPAIGWIASGDNLGFRVDQQDATGVRGKFVVRVNGKWIEIGGVTAIPLTAR